MMRVEVRPHCASCRGAWWIVRAFGDRGGYRLPNKFMPSEVMTTLGRVFDAFGPLDVCVITSPEAE